MAGKADHHQLPKHHDVITRMDDVMSVISELCTSKGLECHAFKIGWYNNNVEDTVFHLTYEPDTLAVLLISTPSMFEKLFKPFLSSDDYKSSKVDPLDQCLRQYFIKIKEQFPNNQVEMIQDFELHPTRRPKILVQTAGHVAGAAYYYQRSDVTPDPWKEGEKIYGVSVHPKYGGWFALRGVLIFKGVMVPELVEKKPVDCVPSRELRIELLEKFNHSWRDWTYRDVSNFEIVERYSDEQKTYFGAEPSKRYDIISSMLSHTAY